MDIEKAREMHAAATAEPPVCACSNPEIVHEEECRWLRWNYEMPPAMGQLTGQAPAAFAALILAVEALKATEAHWVHTSGLTEPECELCHRGVDCEEEVRLWAKSHDTRAPALAAWRAL